MSECSEDEKSVKINIFGNVH